MNLILFRRRNTGINSIQVQVCNYLMLTKFFIVIKHEQLKELQTKIIITRHELEFIVYEKT